MLLDRDETKPWNHRLRPSFGRKTYLLAIDTTKSRVVLRVSNWTRSKFSFCLLAFFQKRGHIQAPKHKFSASFGKRQVRYFVTFLELPSPSMKPYFLLQKNWRRATRHSHINSSMWRCGVNNTHHTQRCSILSQGPSQRSHFSG